MSCVDCGRAAHGSYRRCTPCLDRAIACASSTIDGQRAGYYTALLLGDIRDVSQPIPGTYAHGQARLGLRRARFGVDS